MASDPDPFPIHDGGEAPKAPRGGSWRASPIRCRSTMEGRRRRRRGEARGERPRSVADPRWRGGAEGAAGRLVASDPDPLPIHDGGEVPKAPRGGSWRATPIRCRSTMEGRRRRRRGEARGERPRSVADPRWRGGAEGAAGRLVASDPDPLPIHDGGEAPKAPRGGSWRATPIRSRSTMEGRRRRRRGEARGERPRSVADPRWRGGAEGAAGRLVASDPDPLPIHDGGEAPKAPRGGSWRATPIRCRSTMEGRRRRRRGEARGEPPRSVADPRWRGGAEGAVGRLVASLPDPFQCVPRRVWIMSAR